MAYNLISLLCRLSTFGEGKGERFISMKRRLFGFDCPGVPTTNFLMTNPFYKSVLKKKKRLNRALYVSDFVFVMIGDDGWVIFF